MAQDVQVRRQLHGAGVEMRRDVDVAGLCGARVFFASRSPPTRPSAICRIAAARHSIPGRTRTSSRGAPRSQWGSTSPEQRAPSAPASPEGPAPRAREDRKARARGQTVSARRRHLPVRADEEVSGIADRFADPCHVALGAIHGSSRQLSRVEGRIAQKRVELERREALAEVMACSFGGEFRIEVHGLVCPGLRIDVCCRRGSPPSRGRRGGCRAVGPFLCR